MSDHVLDAKTAIQNLQRDDGAFELHLLLEALPEETQASLTHAYERYTHLIGISSGYIDDEIVSNDRSAYPDLVKTDDQGLPIFNCEKAPHFMSEVSQLPLLLCQLHVVNDNNWLAASGLGTNFYDHSTIDAIRRLIDAANGQTGATK